MRNLKKFLALVLAMMMTLSLMVTVNAKNVEFDDGETVNDAFIDDLTVLAGMGVIKGMGDGTFKPQTTVTRAEMAAIVYRLRTGDADADPEYKDKSNLYAGYGDFSDVKATDWFAGYVGYCANAGIIIGYPNGDFGPNNNVTGYEALVMLLRAMGYDQPGTFTGDDWRQKASSIATQRGMLDKVNTTRYNGTLANGAAREVIAEITFQAATKATVKYDGVNYETTSWAASADGNLTRVENPTLGKQWFGLTDVEAVVLGNQATGEKATILGTAGSVADAADPTKVGKWTEYDFPGTKYTDNTVSVTVPKLAVDAVTGVDLFAHNVKVWYDADSGSTKTAYAVFDQAKSDVIKATALTLTGDPGDIADSLPDGWKVNSTDGVYQNEFFSQFNTNATTKAAAVTTVTADSPVHLFEIIDNDGDGVVDVVIALNIQTSKIIATNTVGNVKYTGAVTSGTDFLPSDNIKNTTEGRIADAALSADSIKTLGAYEMGFHVAGTTPRTLGSAEKTAFGAGASTAYFTLKEVSKYIDSKVLAVDANTKALILPEGKTVDMSIYYDTVVGGYSSADGTTQSLGTVVTLPQVKSNAYTNETYRIWLDDNGDYLGAQPIYAGNEFVYGTYVDVTSPVGSSSFTYQMVGIGMDGKAVTKTINTLISDDTTTHANGAESITAMDDVKGTDGKATPGELDNPVPHRDDQNAKSIEPGQYTGFSVSGDGKVYTALNSATLVTPMMKGDDADLTWESTLKIDADATKLGAVHAATYDTNHKVYFTEKTRFIVVSGNGTDTVEAEVYNGISELLGKNVEVDFGDLTSAKVAADSENNLVEDTVFNQMMYFSSSDFVYAQDKDYAAINVDTVFIPAEALTFTGAGVNSLYYAGSNAHTLVDAADSDVKQYTLYVNGEKQNVWLDNAPTQDSFHTLAASTKKTVSGDPVYTPTAITTAADALKKGAVWVSGGAAYTAQTWDTNTATIGTALYRIADGVKVANVNKDNAAACVWPGIDSLATLNDASSLNATSTVKVNALLNEDGQLAVIYVCYAQ